MKTKLYKRILAALLAFVLFFGCVPPSVIHAEGTAAANTEESVNTVEYFAIFFNGGAVTEMDLPENEKLTVAAGNIPECSVLCWQLLIPGTDIWVDIQSQNDRTLNLSCALLGSLLDGNSRAYVRCMAHGIGTETVTDTLCVTVTESVQQTQQEEADSRTSPEILPAPTVPGEMEAPTETEPAEVETEPVETEPAKVETEPVETVPAEVETEPAKTEPAKVETEQAENKTASETEAAAEPAPETMEESAAPTEAETETEKTAESEPIKIATPSAQFSVLHVGSRTAGPKISEKDYYTVTINYVYGNDSKFNGQPVAHSYHADFAVDYQLTEDEKTITSPICIGYTPNLDKYILPDTITEDITITVEYNPAEVYFTVRHYQQNIGDDNYTWVESTQVKGYTEHETRYSTPQNEYIGFTALDHYSEEIAADSSTIIDIYYDRNYYLMTFDLDGGYGVTPIYARYETPLTVDTPYKAGWTFTGWSLNNRLDEGGVTASIEKTMPCESLTYYANWESLPNITYSVAYWIVEKDKDGNDVLTNITTRTYTADAGDPIVGKDDVCGIETHVHTDKCASCGFEAHTHSSKCYDCGLEVHTHLPSCIASITSTSNVGDSDMDVINNTNTVGGFDEDEIYIYFIQGFSDKYYNQYWPKLYINGSYYTININNSRVVNDLASWQNGEPVNGSSSNGLTAIRYQVDQSNISCGKVTHAHADSCVGCGKNVHIHNNVCITCGVTAHTHTKDCPMDDLRIRHLEYVRSDEPTTVSGDGTTVMNVYYRYKTYTIRYVYARKNASGQYQVAVNTNQGGFDDCNWEACGSSLPDFSDPSGETNRSEFTRTDRNDGCTYYYISLTAEYGSFIGDIWPANNIDPLSGYTFGSWAAAPGTPYRDNSTLNANIVGSYPIMSDDMISLNPVKLEGVKTTDGRDIYLAQNMIAWWSRTGTQNHAYHNFFEVLPSEFDALDKQISTINTLTNIDGKTYVKKTYTDGGTKYTKIYLLEPMQIFKIAHNKDTRVDPLAFTGFDFTNLDNENLEDSTKSENNGNCTICGSECNYCNNFYYNRKLHKLQFMNHGKYLVEEGKGVDLVYGAPLAKYEYGVEGQPGATTIVLRPEKYPDDLEEGAYEFDAWCTTSDCHPDSIIVWEDATMPDADLILYARWIKKTYNIQLYPSEKDIASNNQYGETITGTHDASIPEDKHPNQKEFEEEYGENAEFIGWFYKDKNGNELQFDFKTTPITADIKVYAKWRSTSMKAVEIYYLVETPEGQTGQYNYTVTTDPATGVDVYTVVEQEGGPYVRVADTETLMLRVGQVRTFEARTGNSLYTDYRSGCFPTLGNHSVTPTEADVSDENKNKPIQFVFLYVQYEAVPYQVTFYIKEDDIERPAFRKDENGNAVFVPNGQWEEGYEPFAEEYWNNSKAAVMELYIPDDQYLADHTWTLPPNYLPDNLKKQHIIVPGKDAKDINANTIKFVYTYMEPVEGGETEDPSDDVYESKYLVQYYIQSLEDPNVYKEYSVQNIDALSGTTVTAKPISIPGYSYSYVETNRNKQAGTTLTQDPDQMSGVVTAFNNRLELNFYYTINMYPYQIMYLEKDTERVLAATKTKNDYGNRLEARFNDRVSATAIAIEGYDLVGPSIQSIEIKMEAGEMASLNTIKFYYEAKTTDLVITKTVNIVDNGDLDQITPENIEKVNNQSFDFIVSTGMGFISSVYDCTITDNNGTETEIKVFRSADNNKLEPISLKTGQKVVIHGLPLGEYQIEEVHVAGFNTRVQTTSTQNGTITELQPSEIMDTVTLDLVQQSMTYTANFTNSFPFYTGDLVVRKLLRDENNTKITPDSNPAYRVKVTLKPHTEALTQDRVITFEYNDGTAYMEDGSARSLTIPALTEGAEAPTVEIEVYVPANNEVKLVGVPEGDVSVVELTNSGTGNITDYYTLRRWVAVHKNDEKEIQKDDDATALENETVNTVIHGGHPTAITFLNTCKKGDLTIQKTVTQQYEKDSWESDTFTFSVTGTTELPDGTYTVKVGDTDQQVTVEDGELSLEAIIAVAKPEGTTETSWTESLSVQNLPAGYYTVNEVSSEVGLDKYQTTDTNTPSLVDNTEDPTEFNIINTFIRTTGNLQVGKIIRIVTAGSVIDKNQEFTFVVVSKDNAMRDSYPCTVKTRNGTDSTDDDTAVEKSITSLSVNGDNELVFNLKHDEYILIEGLPVGDYLVKEESVIGYDSSFGDVVSDPGKYSVDPATITTNKTTTLTCQNAFPVYYSNLVVKKSVVDAVGNAELDTAPASDVFTFDISIRNYSDMVDLTDGITAKFYDSTNSLIYAQSIKLASGKLTFTLQAGQWVNLNLPACDYIIAETGMTSSVNSGVLTDHYTVAYTIGDTAGEVGKTYSLNSGETETIVFTNTYNQHYGTLIIDQDDVANTDTVIYTIQGTDIAFEMNVPITGSNSVTIEQIPVGKYIVKVADGSWPWSYEAVASQQSTVEMNAETTVAFSHKESFCWLHFENAIQFLLSLT